MTMEIFTCETCDKYEPRTATKGKCLRSGRKVSVSMSCTKHSRVEKKVGSARDYEGVSR